MEINHSIIVLCSPNIILLTVMETCSLPSYSSYTRDMINGENNEILTSSRVQDEN